MVCVCVLRLVHRMTSFMNDPSGCKKTLKQGVQNLESEISVTNLEGEEDRKKE